MQGRAVGWQNPQEVAPVDGQLTLRTHGGYRPNTVLQMGGRVRTLLGVVKFIERGCRAVIALTCAAAPFFDCSAAAWSAPGGSTIIVRILDDISKRPIPRASVRIVSEGREYDGLTDSTGTSLFENVEPGSYGVFADERDFAFARTYAITAKAGSTDTITILGTRTRPARIGIVQSRVSAKPDPARTQSFDSPSAEIAGGAGAALSSLTAVSGTSASSGIQIHNEGAGLTTATVNGAPIFPSGAKVPSSLFAGDVFSSASVGGGTLGAPDGTLNFSTYEPVIDWGGVVQGRLAPLHATADSFMERGTLGRLGLSFVHAERAEGAPFENKSFTDTSGQTYVHDTLRRTDADALSMRYGFDVNHTGHLDVGRLSTDSAEYCGYRTGPFPCGFGPGNYERRSTSYAQFRDELAFPRLSLNLNAFVSNSTITSDLSRQTVEGELVGGFSRSAIRRTGGSLNLGVPLTPQRTISLAVSSVSESVGVQGQGTALNPTPPQSSSRSAISLGLPVVRTRRFENTLELGTNQAYGTSAATYGLKSDYALTARDSLTASVRGGQLSSPLYAFNGLDGPQLLQVDCASGRALGNGPTFQTKPAPTQQVDVGYSRRSETYQVGLTAYHHAAADAAVTAVLPAGALPPTLFDAAYFSEAGSVASRECGVPFTLGSSTLWYTTTAPVSRLVNDGVDVSARVDINPRTIVTAAYSLSLQRAYGDSVLFARGSTLSPGAALPGATISRLNLSGRYAASRATTLILNLNAFGANNPYLPRSFATLDAGVRSRFGSGDVVVALQNITNTNGRTFEGFDPFPILTQPYTPRTLSIRTRFALGRQKLDRADYLSKPVPLSASLLAYVPVDYEPRPPQGWLAPATGAAFCGPESLPVAKQYLDAIAQYDGRLSQGRANGSFAVAPAQFGDMTLTPLASRSGYAIRIEFSRTSRTGFAPFLRCSAIHEGTYDQARSLGVYIPSWQQREQDGAYVLYYAPQVGVYTAPDPVNATAGVDSRPTSLPAHTPAAPFALAASCPRSIAPATAETVAHLKEYIEKAELGRKPPPPEGLTISRHAASAENWLEIRADDSAVSDALVQCLAIPSVFSKSISERGLGGATPPSINYAPSVGFYINVP